MSIKRQTPHLTFIIPVYNETIRLISGLYMVLSYLKKQRYPWELIIVDDGSTPPVSVLLAQAKRRAILRYDIRKLPVRIVRLPKNSGKGAAVASGVKAARGVYIVFADIDQSVPVTELKPMLRLLPKHPVVIASRRIEGAKTVVHQTYIRETAGRVFTASANMICQTHVSDVTCGFKGFQRNIAKTLFRQSKIGRWVFDAEILFLARRMGFDVYEMPVAWTNKTGSKVRTIDSINSFIDLLHIRWNEARGAYNI